VTAFASATEVVLVPEKTRLESGSKRRLQQKLQEGGGVDDDRADSRSRGRPLRPAFLTSPAFDREVESASSTTCSWQALAPQFIKRPNRLRVERTCSEL
jgi:hypothetical protein